MNEYRALRATAANGAATIRVVTNGAASPRRPGVEIRVHGVAIMRRSARWASRGSTTPGKARC
jgi:hypothetical protein